MFFLKFDNNATYDLRFNLRATQKVPSKIVLVTLHAAEFSKMYDLKTSNLINTNELAEISDSFYWDRHLWNILLKKILAQNPGKVGITLYFGDNVGQVRMTTDELVNFKDPRVIWATNSNEMETLSLPVATRPDRSNIAHIETLKDDDGIVRRLFPNQDSISNLAEKLVGRHTRQVDATLPVINYKGLSIFPEVSVTDIINDELPKNYLSDKIVIIGTEKSLNSQVQTPMGLMSRHKFWATVTENMLTESFIRVLPRSLNALFLLALCVVTLLLISQYPQAVALFFILWLATFVAAFSAWFFDTFYIWIPIVSPLSLFVFAWVFFIGHQALKMEQAHARLQQQQQYLSELEQLKNNFVSLISHDLKTPIAKIQAVLDRLMTQGNLPSSVQDDLGNLKEYSEELNRYIQSILKVLRVESRDFKIMKETADINGVIENVVDRLAPLARSKNIAIDLNLEPMFLIEIDLTLMTEVFLNIIENAIKYTPSGGRVLVHSYETSQDVCIEISDSGEGIAAEDQENIWKKFVRGKAQDYKTKGTGLGLYLVKYFIELHGGKIVMKSELGKGTSFTVLLPIESADLTTVSSNLIE